MKKFSREQVLAYRLRVNHLHGERLPAGSLGPAARSGLQDGSPRSALLSLASRVEGVGPDDWRADGLEQVFGPRGAIYVVRESDIGVFTQGLLPRDPERLERLAEVAAMAHSILDGRPMRQSDLVDELPEGIGNRELRWAACLGTLVPVWDTVDTIVHPAHEPGVAAEESRLELARRFFEYLGPASVAELQWWLAGSRKDATATVAALGDELVEVEVDGRSLLAWSESVANESLGSSTLEPDHVLLLPPDDVYISRSTRPILLPDPAEAKLLWPQAPPPGALVVEGQVRGAWRRRQGRVEITPWVEVSPHVAAACAGLVCKWPLAHDGMPTASWARIRSPG